MYYTILKSKFYDISMQKLVLFQGFYLFLLFL